MTDSIKIHISTAKINQKFLAKLPCPQLLKTDQDDPNVLTAILAKKQYPTSPLTGKGYELKIIADAAGQILGIDVSVNVPCCLVGQNIEHGLSVFAASVASVLLATHYLATHGVPKDELNKLEYDDIEITQVTLTYLIESIDTVKDMGLIENAICSLHPHRKKQKGKYAEGTQGFFDANGNKTIRCNMRPFALSCYAKAPDLLTDTAHEEFGKSRIRIELILHRCELKGLQRNKPQSWVGAHESGAYADIFETYVRNKFFRLHDNLRQNRPDAKDIAKLTGLSLSVFKDYMQSKDPRTDSQFQELKAKNPRAEQKLYSQVKRNIFEKLRIDISIPFSKHMKLSTAKLDKLMVWAGDHHPSKDVVDRCFCMDNWKYLKQKLEGAVAQAELNYLNKQSSKYIEPMSWDSM
jgi:hypothetical protein